MTEKEYRSHPAVSRSDLWRLADSPEKFKFYKENLPEPTPSLVFGQLFHKLALEPEGFADEYAVLPQIDRRTVEGKKLWSEFVQTAEEKTLITAEEYRRATEMCMALKNAPYVNKLLSGQREKEYFWIDEMTGEECKCRADCISVADRVNMIVDIKSTSDATTEHFMKDAISYGYDFQAAMYTEGIKKCTGKEYVFVFIAIEKEPPYAVNILQADKLFIKRGYDIFRELIGIYHDCRINNDWYGYLGKYKMINNLSLPAWLAKEIE